SVNPWRGAREVREGEPSEDVGGAPNSPPVITAVMRSPEERACPRGSQGFNIPQSGPNVPAQKQEHDAPAKPGRSAHVPAGRPGAPRGGLAGGELSGSKGTPKLRLRGRFRPVPGRPLSKAKMCAR